MIVEFGKHDWDDNWNMKINLETMCDSKHPVKKVRKIFTLMVENIENEEKLEEIQQFLNEKSKKYAEIFKEIIQKRK